MTETDRDFIARVRDMLRVGRLISNKDIDRLLLLACRGAAVPDRASPKMLASALPVVHPPSLDDKQDGAAACLLLFKGKDIPGEGGGVMCAAELARDYRAMIEAAMKDNQS
jgi:hypothetical protein